MLEHRLVFNIIAQSAVCAMINSLITISLYSVIYRAIRITQVHIERINLR